MHKKKNFEIGFKSGRAVSTIIFYPLVFFSWAFIRLHLSGKSFAESFYDRRIGWMEGRGDE